MEKTVEDQACSSSSCFFRPSLLCVAVLVPSLFFTCFFTFGFSPFLVTITILILSTVFIVTITKKRVILDGCPVLDDDVGGKLQPVLEIVTQEKAAQQSEVGQVHDYLLGSTDLLLESESGDGSITSEDFELNWMCADNVGQSPATSDGSVSDEEDNLIEICLPGPRSINLEEEPKQKVQPNSPDFSPESILQQHGLKELLADVNEVNEEENLIEIDISMGSIKSSRFEIEA